MPAGIRRPAQPIRTLSWRERKILSFPDVPSPGFNPDLSRAPVFHTLQTAPLVTSPEPKSVHFRIRKQISLTPKGLPRSPRHKSLSWLSSRSLEKFLKSRKLWPSANLSSFLYAGYFWLRSAALQTEGQKHAVKRQTERGRRAGGSGRLTRARAALGKGRIGSRRACALKGRFGLLCRSGWPAGIFTLLQQQQQQQLWDGIQGRRRFHFDPFLSLDQILTGLARILYQSCMASLK